MEWEREVDCWLPPPSKRLKIFLYCGVKSYVLDGQSTSSLSLFHHSFSSLIQERQTHLLRWSSLYESTKKEQPSWNENNWRIVGVEWWGARGAPPITNSISFFNGAAQFNSIKFTKLREFNEIKLKVKLLIWWNWMEKWSEKRAAPFIEEFHSSNYGVIGYEFVVQLTHHFSPSIPFN